MFPRRKFERITRKNNCDMMMSQNKNPVLFREILMQSCDLTISCTTKSTQRRVQRTRKNNNIQAERTTPKMDLSKNCS